LAGEAPASTDSSPAKLWTHSLGHFLSLKHQEDRAANDRFQGTADVAHRLRKVTKSPKRSLRTCDASRHQVPTERLLVKGSNRRCRPKGVGGNFSVERPVHSGSDRSPIMSRNHSSATAVIRSWQLPANTRSLLKWRHPKTSNWHCRPKGDCGGFLAD